MRSIGPTSLKGSQTVKLREVKNLMKKTQNIVLCLGSCFISKVGVEDTFFGFPEEAVLSSGSNLLPSAYRPD